jgi:NADPH-dependent 2,4-dienoyl-CoA reductase/sulfur reductase-like enzyme/rhodanese-related sulfurtransferase
MARKVLIVGGVAGGMSAATRLRRLDENATIVVFERGPHVSFANCGLPYYLGGEITERGKLLVQTPARLKEVFNLDVRVNHEVLAIDREKKTIEVRDRSTNTTYTERYDSLVLATGAAPLVPPIPGIERAGHFTLRNLDDTDRIHAWVGKSDVRRAVVVGAGFIGLEMAEQLVHRGLQVSVVELLPQVLGPLDPEMVAPIHEELKMHGVALYLGDKVERFDEAEGEALASKVVLASGQTLPADVVILGLGVRPESKLAKEAGLTLGPRGGVRVDAHMRTSDPSIWAVGDAVEVRDPITGGEGIVPLAGPANRQGRMVADNIVGRVAAYKGTLGTAIVRVFDLVAGSTGASEKTLTRAGVPFEVVHLHPGSHAGYYPGAEPIHLKVLFDPRTGKLLGAQAVGRDGVDKRLDVFATVLHHEGTVQDLAELELSYAPPFGSAKDPVNLAGMAAQNILAGDVRVGHWHEVEGLRKAGAGLVDVREVSEYDRGNIPGALHIPLGQLRGRLNELDRDREWLVYCQSGQRSYNACRILRQHGYRCRNLTGAYRTWAPMQ